MEGLWGWGNMIILITLEQGPVTKQTPKSFITDTFDFINYTNAFAAFGPNAWISEILRCEAVWFVRFKLLKSYLGLLGFPNSFPWGVSSTLFGSQRRKSLGSSSVWHSLQTPGGKKKPDKETLPFIHRQHGLFLGQLGNSFSWSMEQKDSYGWQQLAMYFKAVSRGNFEFWT